MALNDSVKDDPEKGASSSMQVPLKTKRPAPIILDGKPVADYVALKNLQSENYRGKFTIKFPTNTTALHSQTLAYKKRVSKAVSEKKVPY